MFIKLVPFETLKNIKLQKPARGAGYLWKGIPLHEVAISFNQAFSQLGMDWIEDERPSVALSPKKTEMIITCPFKTYRNKLLKKSKTPYDRIVPVICLVYSNNQLFRPTMYLAARNCGATLWERNGHIVPMIYTSEHRTTMNFNLYEDFIVPGIQHLCTYGLMEGELDQHLQLLCKGYGAKIFCNYEYSINDLMCMMARSGAIPWSSLSDINKWIAEAIRNKENAPKSEPTALNLGYFVANLIRRRPPISGAGNTPDKLHELYKVLASFANA